ncbi:MAG TPA: LysR family transcriptional regulator [Rhodospirillaceae bacterium]|nr:LysR family transcriptional regulator [Rhodospirillaceae bacterium]
MNFTQLRSFHAVARCGSFTQAARDLRVSQPTVTEQVRELEATHGIQVFNRAQRKVRLTAVGRSLYEITQRLFGIVSETDQFLHVAGNHGAGHLRISSVLPFFIVGMLTAFRQRYPEIKVTVSAGNSARTLSSLLAYETDIGVLSDHTPDHRLFTRIHDSHAIVAFVSRDHPWAGRKGIRLGDLDGQPMVLRESGSNTRRVFETAVVGAGVAPKVVLEIESGEAIREAVVAGHGIGVYGEKSLPQDERIKVLPIVDTDIRLNRYLACLNERRHELLVDAFFDVAGELV